MELKLHHFLRIGKLFRLTLIQILQQASAVTLIFNLYTIYAKDISSHIGYYHKTICHIYIYFLEYFIIAFTKKTVSNYVRNSSTLF